MKSVIEYVVAAEECLVKADNVGTSAAHAAAYDAAYDEQVALLARYQSGEQGPFEEETS